MKKRILCTLLAVLMTVTLLPAASASGIVYDIWVNGVSFTDENISSGIPCGSGTATLTPPAQEGQPYVLTLTNATINTAVTVGDVSAGVLAWVDNLKIVLVGTNTVNVKDAGNSGVFAQKDLTIESGSDDASLTVSAKFNGFRARGTLTNNADISGSANHYGIWADVFNNDGSAYAYGSTYALYAENGNNSGINNGTITAKNDTLTYCRAICLGGSYINNGSITATAMGTFMNYGIFCDTDDARFTNNGRLKLSGSSVGISYPNGYIDIGELSYVDAFGYSAGMYAGKGINIASTLSVEASSSSGEDPQLEEAQVWSDHIAVTSVYGDATQQRNVIGRRYAYSIWVNGVRLTSTVTGVSCGGGTATLAPHANDASPYVLTLDGAAIANCSAHGSPTPKYCNIYSEFDLQIVLKGENTVTPADGIVGKYNTGICAKQDLTVTCADENAKLRVTAADADDISASNSVGIEVGGNFENSADVTAAGGEAQMSSCGVSVTGALTNDGTLSATGGGANAASSGITASGALTNSGTLSATGGNVSGDGGMSRGISLAGAETALLNDGTLTAAGGVIAVNGSSCGIFMQGGDAENSGVLTACGGDICDEDSSTYGIELGGDFTNEGSLTANAGSAAPELYDAAGCGMSVTGKFINRANAAAELSAGSIDGGIGLFALGRILTEEHSLLTAVGAKASVFTTELRFAANQKVLGSTDPDADDDALKAAALTVPFVYVLPGDGEDDIAKILKISDSGVPGDLTAEISGSEITVSYTSEKSADLTFIIAAYGENCRMLGSAVYVHSAEVGSNTFTTGLPACSGSADFWRVFTVSDCFSPLYAPLTLR